MLKAFPVVALGGPRQSGKSTLLKYDTQFSGREYRTCDNSSIALALKASADEFLNQFAHLSLDEAQRFPEVFLALKRIVDEDRAPGRFLITGSAQFLMLNNLADSLAGRAYYCTLLPLTLHERFQVASEPFLYSAFEGDIAKRIGSLAQKQVPPWDDAWLQRGAFPEPAWNESLDMRFWCEAYETTYLERDLHELAPRVDLFALQRLLRISATRNGQILNQASLGSESGLNSITTGRYLHILETSGVIYRIPPYWKNSTKRWVKSPKLLFVDVALAAHIAGLANALSDHKHPAFGHAFESFILQNLFAFCANSAESNMELFHVRAAAGLEVDAAIRNGSKILAIEVKSKAILDKNDFASIKKFMEEETECFAGLVLYRGKDVLPLGANLWALPAGWALT